MQGLRNARAMLGASATMLVLAGTPSWADEDGYFVYVSPDAIGVNAFLDMGRSGTEEAAEAAGVEMATYESTTAASRRENVEAALNEGASLIVLLGFEFNDLVVELAPSAPEVDFLIVDQCIEQQPANVHCAVFREYEGAYVLGVGGAMLSDSGHVGVVGALDIPFLHRFTDGFSQGAKAQDPDIRVDVRWVGGANPFADPVRAKEQATALQGAGADVVLSATAGGDFGVFEAAAEDGLKVFNTDVNHCAEAPGQIVDAILKRVDNAITQATARILDGEEAVFMSLGLAEGGISALALEPDLLADSGCLVAERPDVVAAMRASAERIVTGELQLEDPMFAQ